MSESDIEAKKSLEDNFIDWEANTFGFGYGTGEPHTLWAVKAFFDNTPFQGTYDYRQLEKYMGYAACWLTLNILAHADIIEYGTSSRYGWLTPQGKSLKAFVSDRSTEQLVDLCSKSEDHIYCYPDACNCGPEGYEEGRICPNPFWRAPPKPKEPEK